MIDRHSQIKQKRHNGVPNTPRTMTRRRAAAAERAEKKKAATNDIDAHNSKRERTSKAVKLPALTTRKPALPQPTLGRSPDDLFRFLPAYKLNAHV
ncbi:unnamed protein product, partial [Iphiclides podalirius]